MSCSPATDQLPIAELVDHVSVSPVGDIARSVDGTIYYVSDISATSTSIGRRLPCGALDDAWRTIEAPVTELELSGDPNEPSNTILFLAGSPLSMLAINDAARLYSLDLSDPMASPKKLVDVSYRRISNLSVAAGSDRLFYLLGNRDGGETLEVRTHAGEPISSMALNKYATVVRASDGDAFLAWGNGSNAAGSQTARLVFASDGHSSLAAHSAAFYQPPIFEAADVDGGLYISLRGYSDGKVTYGLIRKPSISAIPQPEEALITVATETEYPSLYRAVFGIDGNPAHALLLTPGDEVKYTEVALPVPTL